MVAWTDPVILAKCFAVAQVLVWISAGMIFVETIRYFTFDLSILRGERARRWPQIFYFGIKLFWYVYLCLNVVFVWGVHELNCRRLMNMVELFMGLIAIFSSVLLACRTVCIYQGKTRTVVSVVLTLGALAVTAAWMVGVDDIDIIWVPGGAQAWQDGGCAFTHIPPKYAVKYIVTVIFDFLVLILTTVGIIRMQGGSRLASLLFSQGLFYFAIVSAANLTVCILCLLQLSPLMSLIGAVPSSAVAVLASTRLYVDLAEAARPQPSVESSQLSGGTGEKIASYFRRSSSPMNTRLDNQVLETSSSSGSPKRHMTALGYNDTIGMTSTYGAQSNNGDGKSFNDGSSDLESQTFPLSQSHPYASPTSFNPKSNSNVIKTSTGLPFVASHRKNVESTGGESLGLSRGGSGQRLAIAVERSCEVRSEVVPQDYNFVAQKGGNEEDEAYPNLRRESSS